MQLTLNLIPACWHKFLCFAMLLKLINSYTLHCNNATYIGYDHKKNVCSTHEVICFDESSYGTPECIKAIPQVHTNIKLCNHGLLYSARHEQTCTSDSPDICLSVRLSNIFIHFYESPFIRKTTSEENVLCENRKLNDYPCHHIKL